MKPLIAYFTAEMGRTAEVAQQLEVQPGVCLEAVGAGGRADQEFRGI